MSSEAEPVRIYLHIPALMETHGDAEQIDVPLEVRGHKSVITLSIGQLRMGETKLQSTFVLMADYRKVVDAHAALLPLCGFGAHLFRDYAVTLRDAVREICKTRGWTINNEFGHFPVLHFVASMPAKNKPRRPSVTY